MMLMDHLLTKIYSICDKVLNYKFHIKWVFGTLLILIGLLIFAFIRAI